MTNPTLNINVTDADDRLIGYIPAWNNFMSAAIPHENMTPPDLLKEYNARYRYTHNYQRVLIEFDREEDRILFMLRWV